MVIWRIGNHADLSGTGGMRSSGRWHHRGAPVVYLAARFEDWNRCSARIAREERDKSPRADAIAVAGSVSNFDGLDDEVLSGHFRAQAEALVGEGADLLILETLGSRARVVKAMVAATMDLGVPVWVSLSCVRNREGTGALRFGIEESREAGAPAREYGAFDEAVRDVAAVGARRC